jgi:hypothetical protein
MEVRFIIVGSSSAVGDGKPNTMLNVEPKMPISLKFEVTHYSLRMFKYNIP